MTKAKDTEPKSGSKLKKVLMLGTGAVALAGAGTGAGLYFSGGISASAKSEVNHLPKLVLRSEEPVDTEAVLDAKDIPLKVGTVAVADDRVKIDPRKYEITYFPIEQNFTANLEDGSGFIQIGISLSTYYDGQVISNIRRQSVPIRSAILMVLAEQNPMILSSKAGKQQLQKQLTQAINQVLRNKEGFGGIDNVYFTNLVIQ